MVIGIQFSVLVSGLVCGFDFDGSMQSQCASSTPEPRALVSVAGSAKLRSLNCQIVAMVQFSGQVVDTQGCSKKIGAKKCNLVQKRCNFPFRIADGGLEPRRLKPLFRRHWAMLEPRYLGCYDGSSFLS